MGCTLVPWVVVFALCARRGVELGYWVGQEVDLSLPTALCLPSRSCRGVVSLSLELAYSVPEDHLAPGSQTSLVPSDAWHSVPWEVCRDFLPFPPAVASPGVTLSPL